MRYIQKFTKKVNNVEDNAKFVIFKVGVFYWAADMRYVKEIISNIPLTRKASKNSEMIGMLYRHGEFIPVLDLNRRFYREFSQISDDSMYIVFSLAGKRMASPISSAEKYCEVPDECIHSLPQIVKKKEQCIQRLIDYDNKVIPVLSPEYLFEEMRSAIG